MAAVLVGEELEELVELVEFVAFVTVRFEACDGFAGDGSGTDVCAGCGWLHDEHAATARRGADVRVLRPRRSSGAPQQKAS